MFIKTGDGKITDVFADPKLTEQQKEALEQLSEDLLVKQADQKRKDSNKNGRRD